MDSVFGCKVSDIQAKKIYLYYGIANLNYGFLQILSAYPLLNGGGFT